MRHAVVALMLMAALAGCSSLRPTPKQAYFVLFFVPGTAQLSPEAQQIVRQAGANAMDAKVSKIEIALPLDTPGGGALVEGRTTAIQNILSVSGVAGKLYARAPLSDAVASLPGAANRAEIRLLP